MIQGLVKRIKEKLNIYILSFRLRLLFGVYLMVVYSTFSNQFYIVFVFKLFIENYYYQ